MSAMPSRRRPFVTFALFGLLAGCSTADGTPLYDDVPDEGELVDPPFDVRGDARGLLLVWFDEEGLHTASAREEIPEARRGAVRVDDLSLPPEQRLAPELVYVADLRSAHDDGSYPVRRQLRSTFDAQVERATQAVAETPAHPPSASPRATGDNGVVIYGASWCSACRSAAEFLRSRNVDFLERDIERDPGAREAMMRAAQAAGVRPSGIPVIDFDGQIIRGFDRAALERAIERSRAPI